MSSDADAPGLFGRLHTELLRMLLDFLSASATRAQVARWATSCRSLLDRVERLYEDLCVAEDREVYYAGHAEKMWTYFNLNPMAGEKQEYRVRLLAEGGKGEACMRCDDKGRVVVWRNKLRLLNSVFDVTSNINIYVPGTHARHHRVVMHGSGICVSHMIQTVMWMDDGALVVWSDYGVEIYAGMGPDSGMGREETREDWWTTVWSWDAYVVTGVHCSGKVLLIETRGEGVWLVTRNQLTGGYDRTRCGLGHGRLTSTRVVLLTTPRGKFNVGMGIAVMWSSGKRPLVYKFEVNPDKGSYTVCREKVELKDPYVRGSCVVPGGDAAYVATFSGRGGDGVPQVEVMRVSVGWSAKTESYEVRCEHTGVVCDAGADIELFPDGDAGLWMAAYRGFGGSKMCYMHWNDASEEPNDEDVRYRYTQCELKCDLEQRRHFCRSRTEEGVAWTVYYNKLERFAYSDGAINRSTLREASRTPACRALGGDGGTVEVAHLPDGSLLGCLADGALVSLY